MPTNQITIFEKTYDGESLYDLDRDVAEALDSRYNELTKQIPQDQWGICQGEFRVIIQWTSEE